MEHLPTELRRHILQCLSIPSLKALRQCSKIWGTLGEEYLLDPTYITYPHRDDFTRLKDISKHPRLASYIQRLEFNLGEVNEYHARHNTYFMQYTQEPEYRDQILGEAWAYLAQLKSLKEKYARTVCDEACLRSCFAGLTALKSIAVSLHKVPGFTNSLFESVWRFPSTRSLPRVTTWERFSSLLIALCASQTRLESLSHDRLPFEFFAQHKITISPWSSAFANLQCLSLQIDYIDPSSIHIHQATERLACVLRSATLLRTLHLGFQGRAKFDISSLLRQLVPQLPSVDESSSLDENIRVSGDDLPQDALEQPLFPFLTTLKFEGISAEEHDLGQFIIRHNTLKRLQLGGHGITAPHHASRGGITILEGSLRSLLTTFQTALKLEKFHLQGDVQEEEMLSFLLRPIYDDEWNDLPFVASKMQQTKAYEDFVIRRAEWAKAVDAAPVLLPQGSDLLALIE
ncbi:hypothetical protein PVAG01_01901 [Phlyctema vagabunda]|uniref:F-box domain-containing protein n=1 Tax=Phlyctema vagabunda TaxID=108571 RepID=A0ABR4PZ07_9HELO